MKIQSAYELKIFYYLSYFIGTDNLAYNLDEDKNNLYLIVIDWTNRFMEKYPSEDCWLESGLFFLDEIIEHYINMRRAIIDKTIKEKCNLDISQYLK